MTQYESQLDDLIGFVLRRAKECRAVLDNPQEPDEMKLAAMAKLTLTEEVHERLLNLKASLIRPSYALTEVARAELSEDAVRDETEATRAELARLKG